MGRLFHPLLLLCYLTSIILIIIITYKLITQVSIVIGIIAGLLLFRMSNLIFKKIMDKYHFKK